MVLAYQRSWRGLAEVTLAGLDLDLAPHLGCTVGNVYTYANAGLTLRYGQRLPFDYGPPRARPSLPSSGFLASTGRFAWYLFAALEGRAVAYDIFLDGNTFQDSRSVDKHPLVGDLHAGVVFAWRRVRWTTAYVLRSLEFETQKRESHFGAVNLSLAF